jgi:hypothetical protein
MSASSYNKRVSLHELGLAYSLPLGCIDTASFQTLTQLNNLISFVRDHVEAWNLFKTERYH